MTSLRWPGPVARGHDGPSCDRRSDDDGDALHAVFSHGYWHDEHMAVGRCYEMLNLAAAVERAREFDIIHYEAAYYPMSLVLHPASTTAPIDPDAAPFAERSGSRSVGTGISRPRSSPSRTNKRSCCPARTSIATVLHGIVHQAGSPPPRCRTTIFSSSAVFGGQGRLALQADRGPWRAGLRLTSRGGGRRLPSASRSRPTSMAKIHVTWLGGGRLSGQR